MSPHPSHSHSLFNPNLKTLVNLFRPTSMAHRRALHSISRYGASAGIISPFRQSLKSLPHAQSIFTLCDHPDLTTPLNYYHRHIDASFRYLNSNLHLKDRFFSTNGGGESDDESDDEDEDEVDGEDDDVENVTFRGQGKVYTPEEKVQLAADIGYKVVGPLERTERVFTPYEPVFAVVQVGSHQFKVSNRDSIFVERLKFCEVNDKIILNKVMLLGSSTQTIVGRPIVPEAAVHAVVEEHALDAKVIIFKKKRRKNYRRCKGHRQELTKLRITNIEGIEKPEYIEPVNPTPPPKPRADKGGPRKSKPITKKPEKGAVSA